MASVHKTKNGKYRVCWRESDTRQRSRTCPNLKTARQLKIEVEQETALGRDWRPSAHPDAATLTDMCQAFLNDRARILAPSTLEGRRSALTLFLRYLRTVETSGPLRPALLSREHLAGFYDYMRRERKNTELSAVQRVKMIQGLWRWLDDHDEYGEVVGRAKTIDLPDARPVLRPQAPTWEEVDAMIEELNVEWHRRLLTLLRFTGLRKTQALRLKWDDFNLRRALLTVRPELGKSRQERRGRVVPVSAHLIRRLKQWGPGRGLVVVTSSPGGRIDYEAFRNAWTRAGYPQRQPFHCLRKAFASELRRRGAQLDVIRRLIGHAQGTTVDVYLDPYAMAEEMREAVALIPAIGDAGQA